MKTNLTDKERNKALQRLYGKAPGKVALLIACLIICLGVEIGFVLLFWLTGALEDESESIIALIMLEVMVGVVALLFISMLADYYIRSKHLQEKYELLPSWRKEKLLYMAHTYDKRDGICFDEEYIYGILSEAKRGKETQPIVSAFLYVDIKELAWVYRVENTTAMYNPNLGSTSYIKEKWIRFYTHDGTRFQGKSMYTDEKGLIELIQQQNPNCRLGYKKEWEKQWKKETKWI